MAAAPGLRAADWKTGPRPDWVEFLPRATPQTPSANVLEGGVFDLNIETQINIGTEETFRRNAFLIVNESGLQRSSSLQISFDPSYEQLIFHEVKLIRDGQAIDKLDPSKVRLLNREENLESHLLDGNLTFYYPLEDVRVGDTVEYSYTLKGFQPAFNGRCFTNARLQWSAPVGHQLFRIVGDQDRNLNIRTLAGAAPPTITPLAGDLREWRWEGANLAALLPESDRPDWHCAFPVVRITEMNSWEEVARWAGGLYDLDSPLGPSEKEAVEKIQATHTSETARIEAALKLVQERIRYLGFEIGHGAYRPSPGESALTRAYGDCKDKTQLLVRMLRNMGISAVPVLVNSAWTTGVADFPPTPLAFDHVICRVTGKNGEVYWLDPTLPIQAGPLKDRHAGAYGFGLPVAPDTRDLEAIPESTGNNFAETTETYHINGDDDPVELSVRTVFHGDRADAERSTFQENSIDRIGRNYLDFYANLYPDIEQIEPVKSFDFPEENRFVVEEKYRITNFWTKNKSGRSQAVFQPQIIREEFTRPDSVRRTTPFALPHPRHTIQVLELKFAKPWNVTFSDDRIENEHFRFLHTGTRNQDTIRFRYEFTSLSDHVPPEKIAEYRRTVDAIKDKLGWTFTGGDENPPWKMNWVALIPIFAGLVVAAALIVLLVRFRKIPPPLPDSAVQHLAGLGGWLILFQFGLWLGPIISAFILFQFGHVFNEAVWESMTSPGGSSYHPRYGVLIFFELFVNFLLFPIQIAAVVFFYQRRWIAPRVLIGMAVVVPIYHVADQLLSWGMPDIDSSPKEIISSLFRAAIWIPYFLVSRRVRATFVRP
jgi:hypothetical protein